MSPEARSSGSCACANVSSIHTLSGRVPPLSLGVRTYNHTREWCENEQDLPGRLQVSGGASISGCPLYGSLHENWTPTHHSEVRPARPPGRDSRGRTEAA